MLIQPTDVFMHDYMHALFVDGVLNLVIFLCFEAFIKSGKTGIHESFSEFVSNWKFPGKFHANHLSDIFTSDRRDRQSAVSRGGPTELRCADAGRGLGARAGECG